MVRRTDFMLECSKKPTQDFKTSSGVFNLWMMFLFFLTVTSLRGWELVWFEMVSSVKMLGLGV